MYEIRFNFILDSCSHIRLGILYFILPLPGTTTATAEASIRPYVERLLSAPSNGHEAPIEPLSSAFFFENNDPLPVRENQSSPDKPNRSLIVPPLGYSTFPELPDTATEIAESVFKQAVRELRALKNEVGEEQEIELWPALEVNNDDSDSED